MTKAKPTPRQGYYTGGGHMGRAILQGSGMAFIPIDKEGFRAALKASGFCTDRRAKFGGQAWAALQSVPGDLA